MLTFFSHDKLKRYNNQSPCWWIFCTKRCTFEIRTIEEIRLWYFVLKVKIHPSTYCIILNWLWSLLHFYILVCSYRSVNFSFCFSVHFIMRRWLNWNSNYVETTILLHIILRYARHYACKFVNLTHVSNRNK